MGVSLNFGLNTGLSALEAMQQEESVVSNNIANANTPGYVQETANLTESPGFPPAGETGIAGQVGEGVQVSTVTRQTNAFVDAQDRNNQGIAQMYSTLSSGLQEVEGILNEPSSNSIQNSLDQFFSSWQTLSSDPSSTAARQSVISQAQSLGQTFQTATQQLEQLESQTQAVVNGAPYTYFDEMGTASTNGNTTTPGHALTTAFQVSPPPSTSPTSYQVQLTATGTATGPTYQLQLQTTDNPPKSLGTTTVNGAGQYSFTIAATTGNPAVTVTVGIQNPASLVPSSLGTSGTYTQTDTLTPLGGQLAQLNQDAQQVNELNSQIIAIQKSGESPNQLLDQRGQLLDQMSKMANITYTPSTDPSYPGAVSVSLGNVQLVSASGGTTLFTKSNLANITSGSIAGNQATISDTQDLLGQLNSFLNSFANQVNAIQTSGYGLTGTSTAPALFTSTTDTAGNTILSVDNSFSAADVAASSQPNQPGNNSTAQTMVQLQTSPTYQGGTFDQGIAQMVSQVGVEAAAAQSSEKTANALAQQSSTMRQSFESVDTNQQAALMIQYQNSYSAAAKFISIIDTMMQTVINMVP